MTPNSVECINPASLVSLLKKTVGTRLRGLTYFKVVYRPVISPFHELLALIPSGSRVFDLGCGSGTFLRLVVEKRNPVAVGGIEISEELIEVAKDMLGDWQRERHLEVYDGAVIPDWIAEYDHITLIDVLHHIPPTHQEEFLRMLCDKMKPGSRLIIKDIDAGQRFLVLFNKLHDLIVSREIGHELSALHVQRLIESNGLEIEHTKKTRMWLYPHFTLVCQKRLGV